MSLRNISASSHGRPLSYPCGPYITTRTRRDAIPAVPQSRPQLPDFSAMMSDSTTTGDTSDQSKLEEKLKQFEKEEMERKERNELQQQQQEQNGEESTTNRFRDKRRKNIIFDEERFEDTFLKCLICRENFDMDEKMPKMLPCHHTFCLDCLRQMWRVEGEFRQTLTSAFRGMPMAVKIQCPTCRDGLITSEAEVKRLPNDHTIMELLSFMKETGRSDVQYCSKHQMQPLNFFCEPCIIPVCCDCTVIDHKESKGHIVVNVNEAMDKYTPILETTMEEIQVEKGVLETKKETLMKSAEKLDTTQKDVNDKIKDAFCSLRETIDERERELYEMTEREVGRKREKLQDNMKVVMERDEALKNQLKSLTNAKEEKDISCMFSGHKAARDVLSQKVEVVIDSMDNFAVEFSCDERQQRNIRQEVTNLADIVFQD
ncbi:tripartite motif-containing protein 2-like isoform X2 [Haliotis cracherodii]|uniref:tripartite motif-containing protein 2-like isoform X2 n=1 Tax=Haliotis cracherodii TaxID=6455 RepID=UPI0039EA709F